MRLDILLGVITVSMTILGGVVSVWPPKTKRREITYVGLFIVLGLASTISIVKQSNETERTQRQTEERADRQERANLAAQQNTQGQLQYTKGQLDSISLMVGKFGEGNQSPDIKQLAAAVKRVANASGAPPGYPRVLSVEAIPGQGGKFTVAHKLNCTPSAVAVQMTSMGFIALQYPKSYDSTNIYLIASDSGLTAQVLIWCQQ